MKLKRLYNTQHFIEENYNKIIALEELENISCYSYRNIQRIFKSVFNETIGAYQTRLKLENGYKKIIYTKLQLSDIALQVGYSDLQAFSKAFKKHFDCSPQQARHLKTNLFEEKKLTPKISEDFQLPDILKLEPLTVYYQSLKTNYVNSEIELLWKDMEQYKFEKGGTEYFGIIADEPIITDAINCRYDACVSQQPINKILPAKKIFNGTYARFKHVGSYDSIEDTYRQIYGGWILNNDLEFSEKPIIEHYFKHDTNIKGLEKIETHIFIPLAE